MILHNDKAAFRQAIGAASRYYGIAPSLIEKDYYVTLFLEKLAKQVPYLIFKGGTSLSKCHKIIDRFSEDIDLTLHGDHATQGQKHNLKYTIIEVCRELGLTLLNEEKIGSKRAYNEYEIEFPKLFSTEKIESSILVETVFIQKAYPTEIKEATCIIADWLTETGNAGLIEKYELHSFDICVQTLERTFIDKTFAICDYFMDGKPRRNSRHIYDLSRLLTVIDLSPNLKPLIEQVREDRKQGVKSFSAQDGVNVNEKLQEIIESGFFEKDYNDSTLNLLIKSVSYEEAIKALTAIIQSGLFDNK